MSYIRKTYGVPAKRGGKVKYTGSPDGVRYGVITSARGGYLRIRLDDEKRSRTFHPAWELEYL
jgi:hypothetical protein